MPECLETHVFTYERARFSNILFALAIIVWLISSVTVVVISIRNDGPFVGFAFVVFAAFGVFVNFVMPALTKANGEGRLYDDYMELQLHKETARIYYKDIRRLEFSPSWGKRHTPYIFFEEDDGHLKISMVQSHSFTHLDSEKACFEALFHAVRKKLNRDVKKYEKPTFFDDSECIVYMAVPR